MKIALDWIGEYLSPVPAANVAADALMNAGLPVESIIDAVGVKGPTKVLDVEVTTNRTDCFSHVGLARELSALTGASLRCRRWRRGRRGSGGVGEAGGWRCRMRRGVRTTQHG